MMCNSTTSLVEQICLKASGSQGDTLSETTTISDQKDDGFFKSSRDQKLDVYVWDMDETLILLKSLLNGAYAESFGGSKNVQKGLEIGRMWENHILDLCDNYFFYEQIENYNQPFLECFSEYDDGQDLSSYDFKQDGINEPCDEANRRKLAYRHRAIADKYKQGLHNVFNPDTVKLLDELYEITDIYTERWLSSARTFLEECSVNEDASGLISTDGTPDSAAKSHSHVHVLVTSGSLIPSVVKCLLFRFDKIITHDNIYSAWEVGKLQCFRWIKERFNHPNVRFCAIGDGWEECEAAQSMGWPFVKIELQPGSSLKFPGLTLRTLGHYFAVVYESEEAQSNQNSAAVLEK